MGRNSIWSKEEDDALNQLLSIYGSSRPSDIAHQLKTIYGIQKLPRQVTNRLRLVNPNLKQSWFTFKEYHQIWELIKENGFDWQKISDIIQRSKILIRYRMKCMLRKYLRRLNQVFGQEKRKNQQKIKKLKLQALKNSMQIYLDNEPPCDEVYKQAQEQSRLLVKVLDKMFSVEFENDEDLFDNLNQFTNKNQIQQIFEHLYFLDTMQNIFQNRNTIQEQACDNFFDQCDKRVYKFKQPRTWEEADDISEIYNQVQPDKQMDLNDGEIKLIKQSPMFNRLFANPNTKYLSWYNEGKLSCQENRNYTIVITENFKAHLVEKDLQKRQQERQQKQNITLPMWKKRIRNEREVYLHYDTQKFLNDYMKNIINN